MATQRLVNTNFWKDTYVIDLDPTQKLLFLYFLTNHKTTLAGVYEIAIREAAFDTGIDKDMVEKILQKFCDDEKMHYEKGWLVLRNFVKHQRLNPSIKQGIEKAIKDLPEWLQKRLKSTSFFYNQQVLALPDSPQTGGSLYPDSPQLKLKEAKEKKRNLMPAAALDIDKKLAAKEQAAKTRPFNPNAPGYKKAVSIAEALKQRKDVVK